MQAAGNLVIPEDLIVEFNKIKMKGAHPYMILSIASKDGETRVLSNSC